ncbi:Trihelix transcription factor ASIL2 [Linum grandiflorum]
MDAKSYEDHQQRYNPPQQDKVPVCNSRLVDQYGSEDDDDDHEEELSMDEHLGDEDAGDNNQNNSNIQGASKDVDNDEDEDDDEEDKGDDPDVGRYPKKRKTKSLASSYEFAPRVPPPQPAVASVPIAKPWILGGRKPLTGWTEQETFALLDAWGEKLLQHGRKTLQSDEWLQVADKVSEVSEIERTETQCKNRLDTLKKKYKKEKGRMVVSCASSWVYFKKMDMLMSASAQQQQQGGRGLSCGLDSGEYVFMNPKVYVDRANGFDEMRDSPGNSESGDEDDISDGLPPKKRWCRSSRGQTDEEEGSSSFHLLADSIERFSEIYEKVETSKRQQMVELERMKIDFHRDLEMHKREMKERAQSGMGKIGGGGGHDEEHDIFGEEANG